MTPMDCTVYELRQYTVRPDRRDALISLFDRELVRGQELSGIRVLGQFTDDARPDRFVWLRGFPDMAARQKSLEAFYTGPVWTEHQDAVLPDIIDTSDVLLLEPATSELDFPWLDGRTPGTRRSMTVTIWHFRDPVAEGVADQFVDAATPPLAVLRTSYQDNTFPMLPVRTDAHVVVTFATTEQQPGTSRADTLGDHLARQPDRLRLTPTPRSLLP